MASTNQSPFYQRAEEEFHKASSDEDRIACLEVMIKECPKHKSSENMLRNLTDRLKRLKGKVAKQKKSGKGGPKGIRKADMQVVLVGFPNVGKSSVFNVLTGLDAKVSPHPFSTFESQLGMFKFEDAPIQLVDSSPFPHHDKGLVNMTDTLLLVVDSLDQIRQAEEFLYRARAKVIVLFNKSDLLSGVDLRKVEQRLKSQFKQYDYVVFSRDISKVDLNRLKRRIYATFPVVRVYTKEPKKDASEEPMILKVGSTLGDAAEKILKGMSKKIKRARVWGPSSKFAGQVVGLDHVLKDKDVVEFQTS